MSEAAIRQGRKANARLRQAYFNAQIEPEGQPRDVVSGPVARPKWVARLLDWVARQFGG